MWWLDAHAIFVPQKLISALHTTNQVLLTSTQCLQIIDMRRGSDYAFTNTNKSSPKEMARGLFGWCSHRETSYNPFLMACSEMHKAERMGARGGEGDPGNVFP